MNVVDSSGWLEEQAEPGRYSNASDYVRDLNRHYQERTDKNERMQQRVTEGLESGTGERSMDDLREEAIRRTSRS